MKKYRVDYENVCILFGDRHFSKVVEAESEKEAIAKVKFESQYILTNCKATEI